MKNTNFKWKINEIPKSDDKNLPIMDVKEVEKARVFHKSFPQYSETPLANLKEMAKFLGLEKVCIKDESDRFGLNAFKVLGGSYAIARHIADELGRDITTVNYKYLTSDDLKKDLGNIVTFFSATDGNHGRGVAWAANKLGQKCVIYMPKGSTQYRLNAIKAENAEATIEEYNYDDCVRKAAAESAKRPHSVVIQDTAWEGYEKIPSWIMQGYGTMALESSEQFGERPTHIFIQAGVGSLAGGIVGFFTNKYKDNPPIMVVVETSVADCLYKSAVKNTGETVIVGGEMDSIMAGLCCGEPNITSWDILRNHVSCFVSADDNVTRLGMRMLSAPIKGDPQVVSGESGAVPFGVLVSIMKDPKYSDLKIKLKLDANSKVLLFSTEGNTDPERYENIIWGGKDR
jgi:diaminopropionate ammonia-lyase